MIGFLRKIDAKLGHYADFVHLFLAITFIIGLGSYFAGVGSKVGTFVGLDLNLSKASGAVLGVTPNILLASEHVQVSWGSQHDSTPTSWIGIYAQGETDYRNYKDWFYIGTCSKSSRERSSRNGACSFGLMNPGRYEVRLYKSKTEPKLLAVSDLVEALSPLDLIGPLNK